MTENSNQGYLCPRGTFLYPVYYSNYCKGAQFFHGALILHATPISTNYRRHERAKVREYEQWVHEIDRTYVTPRVLSATDGASRKS